MEATPAKQKLLKVRCTLLFEWLAFLRAFAGAWGNAVCHFMPRRVSPPASRRDLANCAAADGVNTSQINNTAESQGFRGRFSPTDRLPAALL